jgi:hypothetical protein
MRSLADLESGSRKIPILAEHIAESRTQAGSPPDRLARFLAFKAKGDFATDTVANTGAARPRAAPPRPGG